MSFQTATRGRKGVVSRGRLSRAGSLAFALVGLTLLGVGIVSLGTSLLEGSRVVAAQDRGSLTSEDRGSPGLGDRSSPGPRDETLRLTIPEMARIRRDAVPYAAPGDEGALRRSAAIHLKGTSFPWQRGANVYLAGHRLGYPNTESWLTFWNLDKLGRGDRVFLTDVSGTRYAYRVYRVFVVGPGDSWVTEPVAGKSVLTLQTCTLPDYKQRLIVRAELVGKRGKTEAGRRP